jgi:hypothetical protein
MKSKWILSAVLAAGAITASAAEPVATPAATGTSIQETSGDPVIANGKGFEIKKSEIDKLVEGFKAQAIEQGASLHQNFALSALKQLLNARMLMQRVTGADRAAGRAQANLAYSNLVERAGSPEEFSKQIKAAGLSVEKFRGELAQESTYQAVLLREMNIKETDPKTVLQKLRKAGPGYFENLRKELGVNIIDPELKSMDEAQRAQVGDHPVSGQAATSKQSV